MTQGSFNITDLKKQVGTELGVSEWHEIDQDRVSAFAAVTEDFQFIHVDPAKAVETPFGGTIAHGFLPLSLLSVMFAEVVGDISGTGMSLNYGFEAVRFISPVRTGKSIRGRFNLQACKERQPGQWQLELVVSVEIDGEDKPALVARWLVLLVNEA